MFIFERESARAGEMGAEIEGNRVFEVGSVLTAESLRWGLNSQTVRSPPELKSEA